MSMNEKGFNDLSGFLRRILAENVPRGWNTPPDSVFDGAMAQIDQAANANRKRNRKRGILLVLLVGAIGLVSLVGFEFLQMHSQIASLESEVNAILQEDSDQLLPAEGTAVMNQSSPAKSNERQLIDITTSVISNTKNVLDQLNDVPGSVESALPVENKTSSIDGSSQSNDAIVAAGPAHIMVQQELPLQALNGIETPLDLSVEDALPVVEPLVPEVAKRRLSMGLTAGPNWSTLHMSGGEGKAMITEYDRYYGGFQVELDLAYRFANRWTVTGAVSFDQMNNRSLTQMNTAYDVSNETVDGQGNPMYSTEGIVSTPIGDHSTIFEFYTNGTGQNGEMLTNMSQVEQRLNLITATLGVKYDLIAKGRTRVYVGSGIRYSHQLSTSHDMRTEMYMQQKLLNVLEEAPQEIDNQSRGFVSFNVNGGVGYLISERVEATVGLMYARSITSLRNTAGGQPSTHISLISPTVGVRYYLN